MPRRQLTLEERRTIFRLLNAKCPIKEIASQLKRYRSTAHCEINRTQFGDAKEDLGYFPISADDRARHHRQRRRKLVRDARRRRRPYGAGLIASRQMVAQADRTSAEARWHSAPVPRDHLAIRLWARGPQAGA